MTNLKSTALVDDAHELEGNDLLSVLEVNVFYYLHSLLCVPVA